MSSRSGTAASGAGPRISRPSTGPLRTRVSAAHHEFAVLPTAGSPGSSVGSDRAPHGRSWVSLADIEISSARRPETPHDATAGWSPAERLATHPVAWAKAGSSTPVGLGHCPADEHGAALASS